MKNEIKTLDDFPFSEIIKNDLKREAIKHIKKLRELPDFSNPKADLEKVHKENLDEKLFALFDSMGAYDNENVIDWIKYFFGIKEEDLK